MAHELPALPFANDALAPHISAETLGYHHGKHHAGYVKKLNAAVEGSAYSGMSLLEVIRKAQADGDQGVFNNAAQHFNHSFYWKSLSPSGGGEPTGAVAEQLTAAFGSVDAFKEAFTKAASTHFGSGWAWLVRDGTGKLQVISTHDADTPVAHGHKPVITCDVWEHAYYIDYRNARPDYIQAFWKLINWDFLAENL
ncbi:MAG TPA: superoxide dismutase [Deltaproteobacteria bacterium]|nr:superoxide dismutase [Deltaproteobacteria bacterium]